MSQVWSIKDSENLFLANSQKVDMLQQKIYIASPHLVFELKKVNLSQVEREKSFQRKRLNMQFSNIERKYLDGFESQIVWDGIKKDKNRIERERF